jgi:hypothetical protein
MSEKETNVTEINHDVPGIGASRPGPSQPPAVSASSSANEGGQPKTQCRDPQCRSEQPCGRHRCDYPGAGA